MEKIFSFNKFFLFFCAVFILEWIALQVVGYMRLTSMAKVDGERILAWQWPYKQIRSVVEIHDTKILKRDANDATVKVLAKQSIQPITGGPIVTTTPDTVLLFPPQTKTNTQCTATLTYYRTNSQWFLGKVECQ